MGSVDLKYDGSIRKVATGEKVTDFVVFRARDNALPQILRIYRTVCEAMGCDEQHLQSVTVLLENVEKWRFQNPGECHPPDTKLSELQANLMED